MAVRYLDGLAPCATARTGSSSRCNEGDRRSLALRPGGLLGPGAQRFATHLGDSRSGRGPPQHDLVNASQLRVDPAVDLRAGELRRVGRRRRHAGLVRSRRRFVPVLVRAVCGHSSSVPVASYDRACLGRRPDGCVHRGPQPSPVVGHPELWCHWRTLCDQRVVTLVAWRGVMRTRSSRTSASGS
jgi:hypothetical protein